jgi:hypothetical protein
MASRATAEQDMLVASLALLYIMLPVVVVVAPLAPVAKIRDPDLVGQALAAMAVIDILMV